MKIVISDEWWETHGIIIRDCCKQAYSSARSAMEISTGIQIPSHIYPLLTDDDFICIPNFNESVEYCKLHPEVKILIRSTSGVANFLSKAKEIYPDVLTFFPLGSNDFVNLTIFDSPEPPEIIVTGAGDTEGRNMTAWGNGLEFWDDDLDVGATDLSSFSNGVIAGKMLFLLSYFGAQGKTSWQCRYIARQTADRTEITRLSNLWDPRNGYGKINVVAAIAYQGLIPLDPYLEYSTPEEVAELTDAIAELNATNNQLIADIEDLNAQIEALTITKNVLGIILPVDTPFGDLEYSKLDNITIIGNEILVIRKYYANSPALIENKKSVHQIVETYQDTAVMDYIYNSFKKHKQLTDNDLII